MGKIDADSVEAMKGNLAALREMSPSGASKAQVRACISFLRDVKQNLVACWRFAGMANTPRITANRMTTHLDHGEMVVLMGGMDVGQSGVGARMILDGVTGKVALGPEDPSAMVYFRLSNKPVGLDDPLPYETQDLSVSEFFAGVVYVNGPAQVTRFDVIEYAAYRLGAVHSHASQYHTAHAQQMKALDALRASRHIHARDNIEYLLLSIAQELCSSNDLQSFV